MANTISERILREAEEALNYAKGQKKRFKTHKIKIPKQINVRAVRDKLNMTQREFVDQFGFSIRTLEKWKKGIR